MCIVLRPTITFALLSIVALAGFARLSHAQDGKARSPEEVLASKGLKQSGSLFVLESEAAVGEQFNEALPAFARLHAVVAEIDGIVGTDSALKEARMQRTALALANDDINLMLDQGPKRSGIRQNNLNSLQKQWFDQVQQNKAQINYLNLQITILEQQSPPQNVRQQLTAEFEKLLKQCTEKLAVLDSVVKPVRERYGELATDQEVKDALEAIARKSKPRLNLKFGPSEHFHQNVSRLKREKAMIDYWSQFSASRKG
jgi:hypothetical protein